MNAVIIAVRWDVIYQLKANSANPWEQWSASKVWGNLFLMSLLKELVGSIGYLKMSRLKYKCNCTTLFDATFELIMLVDKLNQKGILECIKSVGQLIFR